MEKLPNSEIPYLEFEAVKREMFIECGRLMTNSLHNRHSDIDRSLIEADVKAFLGAHRFNRALMPAASRRRRSGRRRSVISTLMRPPTASVGSRNDHQYPITTTPRRQVVRMNAVTSSSSTGTTLGSPLTTARRLLTGPSEVTPLTRILRTPSRTPQTRMAHYSATLIDYGTLRDVRELYNRDKNLMVRHLKRQYPSLDNDDIERHVNQILSTGTVRRR